MTNQTKPTEQSQDADAAKKRRIEELKARLAATPWSEAPEQGTGQGFVIDMPDGPPKPPEGGPA
jgi:hypothetical protein